MKTTLLVLSLCLAAGFANAQVSPDFPFLTAHGDASIEVTPDEATINLTILAFDENPAVALSVVATREMEVIELLKKFNIGTEDISATQIEKTERRSRDPNGDVRKIIGYDVLQHLTVHLHQIANFPDLMNELVAMQNVSGINSKFSASNIDEINANLVRQAAKDARAKAENLASGLNVKLQNVYAINSSNDNLYGGLIRFAITNQRTRAYAASADRANSVPVMFAPKTISFSESVDVVFRIKP